MLTLGLILGADPGSQADPLATVTYVQRFAQFQHVELAANKTLKLGAGSEMVLLGQAGQLVSVSGVEQLRDRLVNLSTGEPVLKGGLAPFQHYLNASTHELQLRFGARRGVVGARGVAMKRFEVWLCCGVIALGLMRGAVQRHAAHPGRRGIQERDRAGRLAEPGLTGRRRMRRGEA